MCNSMRIAAFPENPPLSGFNPAEDANRYNWAAAYERSALARLFIYAILSTKATTAPDYRLTFHAYAIEALPQAQAVNETGLPPV